MSIVLALALVAAAVLAALALELVVRRLAPAEGFWGRPEPNHSGSGLAVLGSAFAILVAFVMFLSFQGYLNAKRTAGQEARAVETMFHTSELFAPPLRASLQGSLVCYARSVIHQEWPQLKRGQQSAAVEHWASNFDVLGKRVSVRGLLEFHALDRFDSNEQLRDEARHDRVAAAAPSVPGLLWVALIGGGILLVLYISSFANPSVRAWLQLWLICTVAAVGTLNLCVIRFLDTPFSGHAGSITPSAMRQTLAVMQGELRSSYPDTRIPCDALGRPRS